MLDLCATPMASDILIKLCPKKTSHVVVINLFKGESVHNPLVNIYNSSQFAYLEVVPEQSNGTCLPKAYGRSIKEKKVDF